MRRSYPTGVRKTSRLWQASQNAATTTAAAASTAGYHTNRYIGAGAVKKLNLIEVGNGGISPTSTDSGNTYIKRVDGNVVCTLPLAPEVGTTYMFINAAASAAAGLTVTTQGADALRNPDASDYTSMNTAVSGLHGTFTYLGGNLWCSYTLGGWTTNA